MWITLRGLPVVLAAVAWMVSGFRMRMSPARISGDEKGRRLWPLISCAVSGPCLWELGQSLRAPSKKVQSSRESLRIRPVAGVA